MQWQSWPSQHTGFCVQNEDLQEPFSYLLSSKFDLMHAVFCWINEPWTNQNVGHGMVLIKACAGDIGQQICHSTYSGLDLPTDSCNRLQLWTFHFHSIPIWVFPCATAESPNVSWMRYAAPSMLRDAKHLERNEDVFLTVILSFLAHQGTHPFHLQTLGRVACQKIQKSKEASNKNPK